MHYERSDNLIQLDSCYRDVLPVKITTKTSLVTLNINVDIKSLQVELITISNKQVAVHLLVQSRFGV